MAFGFFKIWTGLKLVAKTVLTNDSLGDVEVSSSTNKAYLHNGTTSSPFVTEAHTAALTNKSIDADTNTITNIENADIKALAAIDATKIADGTVSNTKFQYINTLSSNAQTQLTANATAISDHIADATDAHDASAVSFTPVGSIAATDAQAAIAEVATDADTALSNHLNDATDAHDASAVSNVPAGNIAATTVQAAIDELDSEKQPLDSDLTAIAALATTGLIARTGTGAVSARTITGTANKITVTNGDGVSGNPTLTIPDSATLGGSPTTTTQSVGDNSTKIATTEYVDTSLVSYTATAPGVISAYVGDTAPTGFLLCDGTAVSRATYAALFAIIKTRHGVGNGTTTFTLPDYRGKFLRMMDYSAANDPDNTTRTAQTSSTFTVGGGATTSGSGYITVASTAELSPGMTVTGTGIPASSVVRTITTSTEFVLGNLANSVNVNASATNSGLTFTFSKSSTGNYIGSIQTEQFKSHTHTINGYTRSNAVGSAVIVEDPTGAVKTASLGQANASSGGNETRPLNAYINYIIKT